MDEVRYIISDAAKLLQVETHALRYWEEELDLKIPRNEMGHRYYREEEMRLLEKIKLLKDKGYQLKAIKQEIEGEVSAQEEAAATIDRDAATIDQGAATVNRVARVNRDAAAIDRDAAAIDQAARVNRDAAAIDRAARANQVAPQNRATTATNRTTLKGVEAASVVAEMSPTEKMRQFKMIMGEIIEEAIKNNNEELCQTMGETVSDKVLKQMDYLARTKEEKDEERFRRFDEAVREIQKSRQEAATAENSKGKGKNKGKEKKKRGFFGH